MDFMAIGIPTTVALAAVATIGYVFGRKSVVMASRSTNRQQAPELLLQELSTISGQVRKQLASHHSAVTRFKQRLDEFSAAEKESMNWNELATETESLLEPTQKLAMEIAHAYDEIRRRTGGMPGMQRRREHAESI